MGKLSVDYFLYPMVGNLKVSACGGKLEGGKDGGKF